VLLSYVASIHKIIMKCTSLDHLMYRNFIEILCVPIIYRKIGWKCVDWMHLAQDRDQWLALDSIKLGNLSS
jgi:hypothetical protein